VTERPCLGLGHGYRSRALGSLLVTMSDRIGDHAALVRPVPAQPSREGTGGRPPEQAQPSRGGTGGRPPEQAQPSRGGTGGRPPEQAQRDPAGSSPRRGDGDDHPQGPVAEPVSVVMPARNEERYLAESVGRVLSQDYEGDLELILAVGPSTDQTWQLAGALAATDRRITVIDNPTGRIPAALNRALTASRYAVVVRVDARSLLPERYITTAVRTLRDTGAANVGGIMAAEGVTVFQRAVAWAMTSPFGVGSASNHTGGSSGPAATAYLGVFRRTAIEQAGGFDEQFEIAEDWELNHRIRKSGGLVWFQPELTVTYRPRATVRELAVQYFRYGRWRREVCRQHPGTVNLRYLAPPLAAAAIGAGMLAGLAGLAGGALGARRWPALLTSGLVMPAGYTAGIAGVAVRARRDLPRRVAARLPVALATMHLCWGTGFLTSPRGLAGPAGG
jgi:succinoglycan biosynthesis protein ExoA